ncbi:MAG TPA: Rieske 2Fe-2S domain-containing protein [Methylomirabilota bacterium]|nr:Rieske 2Fe-2S domain-containing protein [Methylomirabilota bacterium]
MKGRPGGARESCTLVVGPFDKPMGLFNVKGELFAINAICPHRGGPP